MHRLLQRQLKRYFGDIQNLSSEWQSFLQAVNEAYHQFDEDRVMLERSLELSSQELLQANQQLQELLKSVEAQVEERTAELTKTNAALEQTLKDLGNAQTQLIQAEKMSSLGQLVAGIAHEINNPISFIHGNLNYLRNHIHDLFSLIQLCHQYCTPTTAELQRKTEEIDFEFIQTDLPNLLQSMVMGTNRICEIVLSLRNFSRLDEAEFKAADIHEGLESTLLILQHRLRAIPGCPEVQIIKQYSKLPLIECHPGQLNQVFVNILANAIDAIEEGFETSIQRSKSAWIQIQTSADAEWVYISIADNGPGIPETIRSQIFNPFFTTKAVGKGTGMGMAISYQIVQDRHHGQLHCFSEPGRGTKFVIQIPLQQNKTKLSTTPSQSSC